MKLELALRKQLGDFSLELDCTLTCERTGIFGPSGSGKSTLAHLLVGLLRPDSGRIIMGEQVLFDHKAGINLPPEQRHIGLVFQHSYLFPHMNVQRNLLYGRKRSLQSGNKPVELEEVTEMLNINHLLKRNVQRLSGGERQRVALARTLLSNPRLMVMDEPLSGLDEGLKRQIIPYILQVCTNFALPLLFISHSRKEMTLMVEELLLLEEGQLQGRLRQGEME